ncbi:MAG: low temperature requirement protein A [Thermoleophilia bacterium]
MATDEPARPSPAHRLARMVGRSPHEAGRVASPLELFFDLTFVIAFSAASAELAHSVAAGHLRTGLIGFAFSVFAIAWAWINFTWFASAYDSDDWLYRITTMVQMVGVLILAIGIPALFHSLEEGHHLDNRVIVIGYVVMRVAMIAQWLRVARGDRERRRTALTYVASIAIAQVGWVAVAAFDMSLGATFAATLPLYLIELAGPWVAERRGGTPWHAHHIAERYGLLAIIALGECLIGTIASLSAIVERAGWTVETAIVGLAGTGLAFGIWWMYFLCPFGEILHHRRGLAFLWGYGHIVVWGAIAATGAGLHVAAYRIEGETAIGLTGVVAAVAVPAAVLVLSLGGLYNLLLGPDRMHVALIALDLAILALAVILAAAGASLATCLVVVMLAPLPSIVADEIAGARRRERALERLGPTRTS